MVGDSNSIINQKKMLEDYADKHGYTNIMHFTDDGYSGGSFESILFVRSKCPISI